jgi:hypothetical protein
MTKGAIISKHLDKDVDPKEYPKGYPWVHEAMEEWGKQEAFNFFEFKNDYKRIEGMNHKHNVTDKIGMISWIGASDEKIWEAYKKGEQLKRWYETEQK